MPQDIHYDPLCFYSIFCINPMISTFSMGQPDKETSTCFPITKKWRLWMVGKGPTEFRRGIWEEQEEVCVGEAGREEDFSK